MATDWKAQLSFTDRFASVQQVLSAHRSVRPDDTAADALRASRAVETEAFAQADSLEDYRARLLAQLQILASAAPATHSTAVPPETNDSIAQRLLASSTVTAKIGRYTGAVHVTNGLFSEIYIARNPSFTSAPTPSDRHVNNDDGERSPTAPPTTQTQPDFLAIKATALSAVVPPHDPVREARILRRCVHPNVIALLDAFYDGAGRYVLVAPFLSPSLDVVIARTADNAPPNSPLTTRRCLRDVFAALAYVHARGVIHRDVKPSNILLRSASGPAVLADFGIAYDPADGGNGEKPDAKITDVGTTCYRAPEVLFGHGGYGVSYDLWAAGCVLAEALLGRTLFESGDLGSELTLIVSVFRSLGTPSVEVWPELDTMPDWGKMHFQEFPAKPWAELLPGVSEDARDLVASLVKYSGSQRLTAQQALEHPYFANMDDT